MVRRKRKAAPPRITDPAAALPPYFDDLSAPLKVRKARWNEWMAGFEAWREEKAAWYTAQGVEEPAGIDDVNLIPDAPWDPADI